MVMDYTRCLHMRSLPSRLTLPFYLPWSILQYTAANIDVKVSPGLRLGLAFNKNSSRLFIQGSLIRDAPSTRHKKLVINCQSTIPDEYWKDGMNIFEDVRMRCSRDGGNIKEDLHQNSVWSTKISVKREDYHEDGKMKLPALVDGTSIPISLKKLKKQQQRKLQEAQCNRGVSTCSFSKAFSSMVYILRSLQNYTLPHFFDDDVQGLLSLVHREMQSSFLWLFQQVFACTPKLMISVMILLANFTVHSMGSNLIQQEVGATDYPCAVESVMVRSSRDKIRKTTDVVCELYASGSNIPLRFAAPTVREIDPMEQVSSFLSEFGSGNGKNKHLRVAGGNDGAGEGTEYFQRKPMYSEEDTKSLELRNSSDAAIHETVAGANDNHNNHHQLPSGFRGALQIPVAPITAKLESDNYECYDRTELAYQYALGLECANPMLLANYAQFLYVVRHDHDRAEACFERAVKMDPLDGEAMGRFAMFLWLARRDRLAADRIYKSAIAANPADPFHKGNYAHFLWHAQEEESYQQIRSVLSSDM
ncbi:hypothetical protein O6H91_16G073600 [Diphasiastrum complanatum]|uniref:Uncharacterized protein n=4 Tax=Diphasiastrum complanatum TaxID=34168 RepID=A0ACC2BDF7_DIPCM|nr:hypothetical protein O6H91_16G073600 [Diphasiastrum complanatum]KAJ7527832.1 hypothetical protein O6H91_16G073600 [Diphasiastrum complanatum]KAJ7527833.1 hypothetical protein O6H91_16G073600 [Diphasiastrum complanatum]KAJ7527834.1 hypothetical protein O6H91_16G073600 [Diphasiastrum complanatum]